MSLSMIQQCVLENMTTAVLLLDDELRLLYINSACEAMLDISARRVQGKRISQLVPGLNLARDDLKQALHNGHPFSEREITLELPSRRQITLDCMVTPLSEAQSNYGLLIELQQLDRQKRISREENLIAQQSASQSLIRGLAHEIKNPLGGLRGAAQLLERELPDPELTEFTKIIIGEADRLQNLVNRMLGSHKMPNFKRINIHEVLERVRSLLLAETPNKIAIKRDYDPSMPLIHGDLDQLIQAVLNIARNAVQALDGQGTIYLRTRILRQFTIGPRRYRLVAKIDIEDNGPGIPSPILEQIFYPMVSGRAEGTGLGLSIAQTLINQHGGLIECDSQPGSTLFTLLLPLEYYHDEQAR